MSSRYVILLNAKWLVAPLGAVQVAEPLMAHWTIPYGCALAAGAALALAVAAPVGAQTMSANSASYNSGYGRYSGEENHAIDFAGARDANGNRSIVDGIIQGGATVQARAQAYAAASADYSGGVGTSTGSGTAVGNSLTVITQGDYNTVIVNSKQTNTGDISVNVNGGVGQ